MLFCPFKQRVTIYFWFICKRVAEISSIRINRIWKTQIDESSYMLYKHRFISNRCKKLSSNYERNSARIYVWFNPFRVAA